MRDNYATHKHDNVEALQRRDSRIHVDSIPTSASWINMVERLFRELRGNRIKRSDFHSEVDLEVVIADHIKRHNAKPKLFIWSGRASKKLEKVTQGRKSLDKSQSV